MRQPMSLVFIFLILMETSRTRISETARMALLAGGTTCQAGLSVLYTNGQMMHWHTRDRLLVVSTVAVGSVVPWLRTS
jgi:hypothetical protein